MSETPLCQESHNSQGRILANLLLWKFITIQLVNQKTNFLSVIIVCGEGLRQDHSLQSGRLENWGYMQPSWKIDTFCIRSSLYLGWDITAGFGQQESRLLSKGTFTSSLLFFISLYTDLSKLRSAVT